MYKCLEDFCKAHILQPKTENAVPEIRKGAAIPIWLLAQQLNGYNCRNRSEEEKIRRKAHQTSSEEEKITRKTHQTGKN